MARTVEFWQELNYSFQPNEILVGERSESLYYDWQHRNLQKLHQIYRPSKLLGRPPIGFFAGHRGSGKSSFFFRFLEQYKQEFFVVYFDIEHNLDKDRLHQFDLLYLLGAAIFNAADQEGLNPAPELLEGLGKALATILEKEEEHPRSESLNYVELAKGVLVFTAGVLGSKVGEKLAEALLKPFSITSGISEETVRKRESEVDVQKVVTQVNLIIGDVQLKARKKLLVIVDGMDKIQRPEQAKLLFLDSRALHGPICRIIYTVPMLISSLPEFTEATQECHNCLLPNTKLYGKLHPGSHDEEGYNILRAVIQKRLDSAGVQADEVFEPGAMDLLIKKSGGVLRWLIRLVQDAFMAAERHDLDRVSISVANEAINDLVVELTSRYRIEDQVELRKVRDAKRISNNPICNQLLHALYIVAYQNGETWYDAHPLLWDHIPETKS